MIDPVLRDIHVQAHPETCFEVFTSRMATWWLATHTITPGKLSGLEIEPRVGGAWTEIDDQGNRSQWGEVLRWEPPDRVTLIWRLTADFAYDPALHTEVDVRFAAERGGTRVTLEHSGLDAFGDRAAEMGASFGGDGGWPGLLAAFAGAV